MPFSHRSEIATIHPAIRRVTGSVDIPLTDKGIEHAAQVAGRIKNASSVQTSPMIRAVETAKAITPNPQKNHSLAPWALGDHEGKPSEQERPKIHKLIATTPDMNPGTSRFSGKKGETFNQFRKRMLWNVRHKANSVKPGQTVVDVTHGRNIRLVDAWLKAGAPEDLSISKKAMLSPSEHIPTGDLERVDMKNKRLEHVSGTSGGGYFLMRHGDTEWNQSQPGQQETGS